jgi:ankyrin repeat protein
MRRRGFLAFAVISSTVVGGVGSALAQQFDPMTLKPIVKAVRESDEEKVRGALLKGESPNQDSNGQPLLMVAVLAGQLSIVEILLKGGAFPDAMDREGNTSLTRAAEKGDVDVVEILLARNARVDGQTRQGATALSIAARRGYAEVVRALLAKKADPNKADFTGRTPLAYARQAGKPAIEAMLRKAGARD